MGSNYQFRLGEEAKKSFELLPVVLFTVIFPVVIGLFLRLPRLIIEMKENKQWTVDLVKLITIGLPTLYIILMSILPFTALEKGYIKIPEIIIIGSPTIQIIAGVVFGYNLLDSLKK